MKNQDANGSPTPRDIMDRYSPIVNGRTGLVGAFLKVVARAVEFLPQLHVAPSPVPVPNMVFSSRNAAGQMVMSSNVMLASTFNRMEKLLQKSFDSASKPDASINDRQKFVSLAQQIEQDAAVLAGHCLITNPAGVSKYQFTLQPNPGQHIPLSQAFAAVQKGYRADAQHQVELLRFGTERPVIMMRPVNGFKAAGRRNRQPFA